MCLPCKALHGEGEDGIRLNIVVRSSYMSDSIMASHVTMCGCKQCILHKKDKGTYRERILKLMLMDVSSRFPILHFPQLSTRKTPQSGQHGIRILTFKASVRVDATLHASAVDEDAWPKYGHRQSVKQAENIIVLT